MYDSVCYMPLRRAVASSADLADELAALRYRASRFEVAR